MRYKILLDGSNLSLGGGVQVGLALIQNFINDTQFEVFCVASPQIDNQLTSFQKQKIDHYVVKENVPIYKKFSQGREISAIEEQFKPDLVFIIFGPAYWKPKNVSLQGFALGKMLYKQELNMKFGERLLNFVKEKFFLWSHSYLLVETELVKKKLAKLLDYSLDEIFVIGNSYSPSFKQYVLNNENNTYNNSDNFIILAPGSYYPHKNLERVIEALALINKENTNVKVLFTIPPESEGWKKLTILAKELNVSDNIDTSGFIENSKFARLYLESNAVICSSLVESSTAVFPEAFLAKRPLLVSDRAFATELCEDAALYFNPTDAQSIARAIIDLITDINLQQQLVERGTIILEKNYPSAESKWIKQKSLIVNLINESK